jgi:peptide/nickel transport system substrate-binding protein
VTRVDRVIVGALTAALVLLGFAVGASTPTATPSAVTAGASPTPGPSGPIAAAQRVYREGVIGRATSITPLTARTQADRDLVGLIYSGLVALGPNDALVPDLASDWSTSKKGSVWTFHLRNAAWHDGAAVTASDVVFTVHLIQDPDYTGPALGSWKDVTATAVDERTVRFELATPLGGFLQAATLPILPAHLLEGVPIDQLAEDPFAQAPVGTGPFRLVSLADDAAVLAPAATNGPSPSPGGNPAPGAVPLPGIELRFFDDPGALVQAYESGDLDAASGLPPADASRLGASAGSRLLRYPTTTLTALFFNLRSSHRIFQDWRVRKALLMAINRPDIVMGSYGGAATTADSLIPRTSWAFDRAASPSVGFNRPQAAKTLRQAGWTAPNGRWKTPNAKAPVTFDVLGPDETTNPETSRAVGAIVAGWQSLGLRVRDVGLSANELITDRIPTGNFETVVVDIDIGLDPDLYPLLASTQTRSGGLNIGGIQNPTVDAALAKARAPGTQPTRRAAYKALQQLLSGGFYVLPICFRDELVVVRDTVSGQVSRPIADASGRFWDVLSWRLAIDR